MKHISIVRYEDQPIIHVGGIEKIMQIHTLHRKSRLLWRNLLFSTTFFHINYKRFKFFFSLYLLNLTFYLFYLYGIQIYNVKNQLYNHTSKNSERYALIFRTINFFYHPKKNHILKQLYQMWASNQIQWDSTFIDRID